MLGNVSEDFSANKLKTSWLNGYVDDFSVNCDSSCWYFGYSKIFNEKNDIK